MNNSKAKYKKGDRFGRIVVQSVCSVRAVRNLLQYACVCDCGKTCIVVGTSRTSGNTKSCGCLRKDTLSKNHRKSPGESSFNSVEIKYKHGARKRGLKWKLTRNEFRSLIKQNCHWCGANPKPHNRYIKANGELGTRTLLYHDPQWVQKNWILCNGLDRVNNEKGYTVENTVPCCYPCNSMKSNFSATDFLLQVAKIYAKMVCK